VIAHGVSEHADRYSHVAARLVGAGYGVYALDHRGHGRSEGKRAVLDRMARAVADLDTLIGMARAEHPGVELFLLGHSMGGAISLEYALEHQERIDGLVLSAPAAALEAASPLQLAAGRVLSAVAPSLGVFAVDSSTISRDPEVVRAYDEDPMVFHGKLPARTVSELAGAIKAFPDRTPSLELPLLVMVGTADRLVPPDAARMVHERASSADKRLIEYDGLYHEILNEPEQDRVMDDLVAWLDSHL
jgi:acylglycerol lipase